MQYTTLQPTRAVKMARLFTAACGLAALSTLAVKPARADVLEQKWEVGQQLSYDLKMDGTLRFQAPADVPMIGGLPLELLLTGEGQSTLDTREIDEFGVAVVVPRLERLQLKFNETNFDQKGVLGLRDGRANISLNGQPMGASMDWSKVAHPDYGLRITKSLRVLGAKPLNVEAAAAPEEDEKPVAKNSVAKNPLPFNFPAMMQAMITRVIPPLLPTKSVVIGDSWTTNIEAPVLPRTAATEAKKAPLGKFDFKALAEEEIAGRKTWRIAVDGVLKVTDLSTQSASEAMQKNARTKNARLPKLLSLTQKMKGDVWFDVAKGQVVRVDMNIDATAEGREAEGKDADGDMTYNGTMQMELRKVAFAGNQ